MPDKTHTPIERFTLYLLAISLFGWGVPIFIAPDLVFMTIGGATDAVPSVYSRYSGAWFIGPAIAAVIALKNLERAERLYELCGIAGALSALVLGLDFFRGENPWHNWFIWVAIGDAGAIAIMCLWVRSASRN